MQDSDSWKAGERGTEPGLENVTEGGGAKTVVEAGKEWSEESKDRAQEQQLEARQDEACKNGLWKI